MYRGTTPTNTFNVDIDLTDAEVVYITYQQRHSTVIERSKSEIDITPTALTVQLTQEETLRLAANISVVIQIRARFSDGTAVASNIIQTDVQTVLKSGVI